jgi:hypothetical protein
VVVAAAEAEVVVAAAAPEVVELAELFLLDEQPVRTTVPTAVAAMRIFTPLRIDSALRG